MYLSMQQGRLLSSLARPCRFIAHRRYPALLGSPARRFHLSRRWQSSTPSDPEDARGSTPGSIASDIPALNTEQSVPGKEASPVTAERAEKKDSAPYGSAVRRALRNKKPAKEWTTPTVPAWFYERNIVANRGDGVAATQTPQQLNISKSQSEKVTEADADVAHGGSGEGESSTPGGLPETGERYALTEEVWEELCASARAGLRLPPAKYAKEPGAQKSHLVLHYPGPNGVLFLDAVVKRLAHELDADVVTLNAQDIAQLCSEQDLADVGTTTSIRSLGYEVYRPGYTLELDLGPDEDDADDIDTRASPHNSQSTSKSTKIITFEPSRDDINSMPSLLELKAFAAALPSGGSVGTSSSSAAAPSDRPESRRLQLIHELISSVGGPKRQSTESAGSTGSEKETSPRDVIVQVQDYGDIQSTREGGKFSELLQKAIQERRSNGSRILFVGTSSEESTDSDTPQLLHTYDDQFTQMLVITPAMSLESAKKIFSEDQKKYMLEINIRHMQDMLRTRLHESSSSLEDSIFGTRSWSLDASVVKESGLNERYWPYSQVHWAATLALGSLGPDEPFGLQHIQKGLQMVQRTDRIKDTWLKEKTPKAKEPEAGNDREQLLSSLRKDCNTYEKKLLSGVVDAKSIRTTFSDVQVPPETIDALKTLTSLSLIRPEAFTYGVLATDKIPGLLLYGPPGTGKTLLAKAVARESGATVLEVSGSEVYDMYVGEGEKNVKAIFTLAKKLSPCVVFIDEADAILCSRTGASSRTSHRELINQFLREWDGMNEMSAFIMVATNRPFDLDDAVLRRLPRRLLVDLPLEQDRLEILKIHLKDEQLDSSVDLAELSRRTQLYSGSDLKNLSVAAALACVREENDLAAQHQGDEPYQYPERRTLTRKHFERGMEEISASISEDMTSLSAIRKFDEQYGDRKGRRKKSPGWGFAPANAEEPAVDAARVRT
ncbi:hypothetical protein BDV25DRAFT_159698 [Aspergillus avenaceus]|uniref:AAA+ ATPase domain-containing protein n=1 Tax=Aspergillus avenaceus TaxID=36643 RepID=A0A5N6TN18_ASPAV|nr:hypothetical protein BDV25DRAFT_159698 [Aspergillus avenaceus]